MSRYIIRLRVESGIDRFDRTLPLLLLEIRLFSAKKFGARIVSWSCIVSTSQWSVALVQNTSNLLSFYKCISLVHASVSLINNEYLLKWTDTKEIFFVIKLSIYLFPNDLGFPVKKESVRKWCTSLTENWPHKANARPSYVCPSK